MAFHELLGNPTGKRNLEIAAGDGFAIEGLDGRLRFFFGLEVDEAIVTVAGLGPRGFVRRDSLANGDSSRSPSANGSDACNFVGTRTG